MNDTEVFDYILIAFVLIIVAGLLVKGCDTSTKKDCFEQTNDVRCWGLK